MNRYICKGCRNPCYLVMFQPNSFVPERCFLNDSPYLKPWETDTQPHKPKNCKSFICNGCDTGKCYVVAVGIHSLSKPEGCVYLDAFEPDWRPLE
jgi:hypothetical protein